MLDTKRKKEKNTFLSRLSKNLVTSVRLASFVSEYLKEKKVSPVSLFAGIVLNDECIARKVISETGVNTSDIFEKLLGKKSLEITGNASRPIEMELSNDAKEVLNRAFYIAQRAGHVYVGTEHVVLALLEADLPEFRKLKDIGLTYDVFKTALNRIAIYPIGVLSKPWDPAMEQENAGLIDFLGTDLVELAREGRLDPVLEREKELDQLESILSRRRKNNAVIVGEAGVGKTVLVEGLAQRIADGHVNPSLRNANLVSLNIADIMAGSKMRGDVEEKVMAIIEEVSQSENTILFIDEIHNIVAPGIPGSSSDIASVLKPALTQGDFRCIGATTTEDFSAYFETDNALARRFQPLFLDELSVEGTIKVLERIRPLLEKHHMVKISDKAIHTAANLSDRYVADRYLPDKAIDVLDEASASKKLNVEADFKDIQELKILLKGINSKKEESIQKWEMEEASKLQLKEEKLKEKISKREKALTLEKGHKRNEINSDDIRNVISKWTGIPVNTLGSKEKNALVMLNDNLKKKVIGQEEACNDVANAVKRARTGISDADRPWASFLFLGPTGVGKTELAKVLAQELFGNKDNLIQIDMSEMMEMHSVSKLIGSPPGYIGFQQGGWLTEKVRRYPHSVILFDEVEKAHPDVLNVLLQILEYGHLMDGRGRRVNFKNTVVILTSNIGAEEIGKSKVLGFSNEGVKENREDKEIDKAYSSMKEVLMEELRNTLRPELLNRLDDIIIFRSLTRRDARKIVRLLLSELNDRLKEEKIVVKLDSKAVGYIVTEAFSEQYGARPLRRFIQDKVENLLADYILNEGDGTKKGKVVEVLIGLKNNELVILKNNRAKK